MCDLIKDFSLFFLYVASITKKKKVCCYILAITFIENKIL